MQAVNLIYLFFLPFIALILEGFHRKINARFENRSGPPLMQPFYDLHKLWSKKKMDTGNDFFFKSAPFFYFIATISLFLFVPIFIISFSHDFILLIYLSILGSAFYMIAGISSDSPYAIVGSMKEMVLMVCYEINLAVILFTFIIFSGGNSIAFLSNGFAFLSLPFASLALLGVAVIEIKRTTFDSSESSLEIMSSMEGEYSGKLLFFMELSKYLKKLFFILLIPLIVVGTANAALYIAVCFLIFFFISLAHASMPRYKEGQALKYLLILLAVSLAELIRVSGGFLWVL